MTGTAPTTKSVLWVAADTGGVAALSMLAMLLSAHFIKPDQFGIAALATGSVLVVNLYIEGLFHDVLLQRENADEAQFRAAFWAVVLIGTGVFATTAAAALLLVQTKFALFTQLLACSAAALPFSAVIGVSTAKLRRGFEYNSVAIPSVTAKVVGASLGLGLAIIGWGAWSLVVQYAFAVALQAAILMVRQGWWPAFTLDFRPLRPLWSFAIPYAGMHTLVGLRIQAFAFVVAGSLGLTVAGYINVGLRLTLTPQIMLQTALINLGLPMLARQQSNPKGFAEAYDHFNRLVAAAMCPLFFGLAAAAPSIVPTILGARWIPSIVPMRFFAVFAALYLIRMPSALLLRAKGWVKYSVANAVFSLLLTVGGMLLWRPKTIAEAAFWWALPLVLIVPVTWVLVSRRTGISVRRQIGGVWPAFASSGVMVLAVLAVAGLMKDSPPPTVLAASVAVGAIVYIGLVLVFDDRLRRLAADILTRKATAPSVLDIVQGGPEETLSAPSRP